MTIARQLGHITGSMLKRAAESWVESLDPVKAQLRHQDNKLTYDGRFLPPDRQPTAGRPANMTAGTRPPVAKSPGGAGLRPANMTTGTRPPVGKPHGGPGLRPANMTAGTRPPVLDPRGTGTGGRPGPTPTPKRTTYGGSASNPWGSYGDQLGSPPRGWPSTRNVNDPATMKPLVRSRE